MSYARARLWLGISCVGAMVTAAIAALLTGIPQQVLPTDPTSLGVELVAITSFLIAIALVLLPFDVYGGLILPELFHRGRGGLAAFARRHLRAVGVQLVVFVPAFLIYRRVGTHFGTAAVVAVFAFFQVLLLAGQWLLARAVGALAEADRGSGVVTTPASEPAFTGGVIGLPGQEMTVVPKLWVRQLPGELLDLALYRRRIAVASGSRVRGLIVAGCWNLACFALALNMPAGGADSIASLVTSYLYFLLFSFLGLLVLPTISRRGVFEIDQHTLRSRPHVNLDDLVHELDRLGDEEPDRSPGLESVFHPIPCVRRRTAAISMGAARVRGAWNAARTALYLSWAFGGPLARAVHCNVGRHELWVLLPAD